MNVQKHTPPMLTESHRRPSTSAIIKDTWPIFIGMSSAMLTGWVDTVVASRLSVAAIAAVGICSFVFFFLFSFANGFATAFQRAVAASGTDYPERAGRQIMTTALLLAIGTSLVLAFGLWAVLDPVFQRIAPDAETTQLCKDFMSALLAGLPFYYVNTLMRGYLSARNKQKVFMRNNIVIQVANIILSIGLGLGMFGFPNLGVFGIGVATSCSYFIGTMLYVPTLANVYRPIPSTLRRVHPVSAPQLVRTAFVAGASLNLYALGWVVSFWIVGLGGQDNVAAYQIVAQLTLPAIYLANSFGVTAINFASIANVKILGSAAIDDALKVVRVSAIITLLYGVAATAVAPTVVDWLTNGTLAGPDYVTYVRLSVLILCIYTSGVVLVNTIQGFGKFAVAFAITVSSQWLIFLPLVWFSMSQLGIGLYGVFGAELAYRIAVCVLGFLVLSRLRRRSHN